jgi:ATP-dependent Lhr-like helicase
VSVPADAVDSEQADRLHPVVLHHIVNTLGWSRLRPLQRDAIEPLLNGDDALLLAPTAGGKTEAACFPLLSRMERYRWNGISVVYLCPLKALLNNLVQRVDVYAQWIGRRAQIWHGDTTESARRKIRTTPPDILLTTPESLEAMLIGFTTDHGHLLGGVRAVIVDEVHAFAGDDRGWHLLAVLERLSRVAGRPIQRVGLSATVGNPQHLLGWLQGSAAGTRPAHVIAPDLATAPAAESATPEKPVGDVELDYVGSLENAAKVIAALHRGEKRLVFCESRSQVEQLGAALRERGVEAFLSHASLSLDERRRSEQAFAEARDCVIVSTSTLELGIDVGDLDRVIQIDAPATVAAFLQRIGRSGRREGSNRNCLVLATSDMSLLQAAGVLVLWARGWVEPVQAPPSPLHLVAQQLIALCLQNHRVGDRVWTEQWNGLRPFDASAEPILRYLVEEGFLEREDGMLFVGPQAERHFGRRHFMALTAAFTAPPQFTAYAGRSEIGRVDPTVLTEESQGPRRLLLAGRNWQVTHIDWVRHRVFVEPTEHDGVAKWSTGGIAGLTYTLTQAMREVLLGQDPPVRITRRATTRLGDLRTDRSVDWAHPGGTLITRVGRDVRWWTWGGYRANATLAASLPSVADPIQRPTDAWLRLHADVTLEAWRDAAAGAADQLALPTVDPRAVRGLKFSAALPADTAAAVVGERLADLDGARALLQHPVRFHAP